MCIYYVYTMYIMYVIIIFWRKKTWRPLEFPSFPCTSPNGPLASSPDQFMSKSQWVAGIELQAETILERGKKGTNSRNRQIPKTAQSTIRAKIWARAKTHIWKTGTSTSQTYHSDFVLPRDVHGVRWHLTHTHITQRTTTHRLIPTRSRHRSYKSKIRMAPMIMMMMMQWWWCNDDDAMMMMQWWWCNDDDAMMMMQWWWWWWWCNDDDDDAMMMMQWWWCNDDDAMMMMQWWWCNDDDAMMMMQWWWWWCNDDDAMMMMQWWWCNDDDDEIASSEFTPNFASHPSRFGWRWLTIRVSNCSIHNGAGSKIWFCLKIGVPSHHFPCKNALSDISHGYLHLVLISRI